MKIELRVWEEYGYGSCNPGSGGVPTATKARGGGGGEGRGVASYFPFHWFARATWVHPWGPANTVFNLKRLLRSVFGTDLGPSAAQNTLRQIRLVEHGPGRRLLSLCRIRQLSYRAWHRQMRPRRLFLYVVHISTLLNMERCMRIVP